MENPELNQELARFTDAPRVDGLGELSKYVRRMLELEERIEVKKAELAELNGELQSIKVGKIPGMMNELNIGEVKTTDGHKITVVSTVQCKFFPEHKQEALQWLSDNGQSAIIKTDVSLKFGKDTESQVQIAVDALREVGFQPDIVTDVHAMTLKAWATRQLEAGGDIPGQLFDLNVFQQAKVK